MDFKRVWIKFDRKIDSVVKDGTVICECLPMEGEDSMNSDYEISSLLNTGWKIVSTTPVIGSVNLINAAGGNSYLTYTSGIEVFMVKD